MVLPENNKAGRGFKDARRHPAQLDMNHTGPQWQAPGPSSSVPQSIPILAGVNPVASKKTTGMGVHWLASHVCK